MCRFVLYSGPPVTLWSLLIEPTNSLVHQSFQSYESEDPLNGDGFGIAWYVPKLNPQPGRFRSTSPAWSNRNLESLSRVTESDCILAHVRAATQGLVVSESNCHPFVFEQFAFMHNGDVGGFHRIRRRMIESLSDRAFDTITGGTDSEHIFAMLLDELQFAEQPVALDEVADALRRVIQRIERFVRDAGIDEPSYLNMAVTDGHRAVVSRYISDGSDEAATLYYSVGRRYQCQDGVCKMIPADANAFAVIVSSEPLSSDEAWRTVPVNHFVTIDRDRTLKVIPIATA